MIEEFGAPAELGEALKSRLDALSSQQDITKSLFDIALIFYKVITEFDIYRAIDLHGTEAADPFDLNEPLPIEEQFDLVTNLGTAEHVFNQYQFFRSVHESTSPGGLMVHALPNQGAYDHGFYNFHPIFVFDLCRMNGYDMLNFSYIDGTKTPKAIIPIDSREKYVKMAVDKKLSDYSALIAVLRKASAESEFKVPQQGYYDNALPPDLAEAWSRLPR